jgi:hypothetical protein
MFFPIDLSSLFKLQQRLSPKKLGANIVKSLNTIRRGIAPPLQNGVCSCSAKKNYLCSIMPAKLLFLFQPVPVFVGNLAQNSTRLSLSNEPMLLIRSCLYNMPSFLLLFHTNNTLSITFKHETITLKIFRCVSLFLPKLCMIIHVHKDFWEFKV